MADPIHVYRKILRSGVEIRIKRKKYPITYPQYVWKKVPKSLHKVFADCLSYVATWHLPLIEEGGVVYHFAHPPIEPVFFKLLMYSIPMNYFEFKDVKVADIIKKFYNANFQTQFKGINYSYSGKKVKKITKESAVLLFSFGKDSLLTYALLKELGVKTTLVFMKEPQCMFENNHKKRLANKFNDTFNQEVFFFPLSIGKLRQTDGYAWGWDIILSQYAFILIPYYFHKQAKYFFFGNEQSCNFYTRNSEDYLINPVFEQSVTAMQHVADIPKLFFINTHVGSLIEPVNELFITYILHHRYPEIGRFQMSCFSDEPEAKKRRWCGKCEKCARMYIFFRALNISPDRTGFYENNMLSLEKKDLYVIFNHNSDKSAYGGSGLGRDEQLIAFYMAYRNGAKGELIDLFKTTYLADIEIRKDKLIEDYFGIHSSYSLPSDLRKKTLRIFESEKKAVMKYVYNLIN